MEFLLIGLVWLPNLAVSPWNAYAVGKSWAEARAAGGWPRLLCWAGAVMSASGFSWCYLILLALAAYHFGVISQGQAAVALDLGYVLLIPGIPLSGLVITLDSWARAFRRGGFLNYGAAWRPRSGTAGASPPPRLLVAKRVAGADRSVENPVVGTRDE